MCDLAARPQTAIRRRLVKPNLQLSKKLMLENRRRRTIVAITQRLRAVSSSIQRGTKHVVSAVSSIVWPCPSSQIV
jgi:ribosomal protein L28